MYFAPQNNIDCPTGSTGKWIFLPWFISEYKLKLDCAMVCGHHGSFKTFSVKKQSYYLKVRFTINKSSERVGDDIGIIW